MPFEILHPLAQLQADAITRIDGLAEKTRLKYITDGTGQALTYTRKLATAEAYVAAGYPTDTTAYPWLHDEAILTGIVASSLADMIIANAAQWDVVGSQIEAARRAAKITVLAATATAVTIRDAETTFNAQIGAL